MAALTPETIRLLKLLQRRIRAVLHGSLARDRSTARHYLSALDRIDTLVELPPHHRLERAEVLLGGLSEVFLSRRLETIAGRLPEFCDGLLYTGLASALIDDERCHFTGLGNIQLHDGGSELRFTLKPDRPLLGYSYQPPSSSDVPLQVGINSWHDGYELKVDSGEAIGANYDTMVESYLRRRLPAAIANVRHFGNLSNAGGHAMFSLHAACVAYGIYACSLGAIASILRSRGFHDVPLIGRFQMTSPADRVSFDGAPEFIALLSSNLPIYA